MILTPCLYAPITMQEPSAQFAVVNDLASDSHLDLDRAPYGLYGVKCVDLVSFRPLPRPKSSPTRSTQRTSSRCCTPLWMACWTSRPRAPVVRACMRRAQRPAVYMRVV